MIIEEMIIKLDESSGLNPIGSYLDSSFGKNWGNELNKKMSKFLVSFVRPVSNSNTQKESFGTGVVVRIGKEVQIITALHVISGLQEKEWDNIEIYFVSLNKFIKIKEIMVINQGGYVRCDSDRNGDVSFIYLNSEVSDQIIGNNGCISYCTRKEFIYRNMGYIETSTFMIVGFPSNKNKTHTVRDKTFLFNSVEIVTHSAEVDVIKNQIMFTVVPKDSYVEKQSAYIPNAKNFSPVGMSGSPMFQLFFDINRKEIVVLFIAIFTSRKYLTYISTVLESHMYMDYVRT